MKRVKIQGILDGNHVSSNAKKGDEFKGEYVLINYANM